MNGIEFQVLVGDKHTYLSSLGISRRYDAVDITCENDIERERGREIHSGE